MYTDIYRMNIYIHQIYIYTHIHVNSIFWGIQHIHSIVYTQVNIVYEYTYIYIFIQIHYSYVYNNIR